MEKTIETAHSIIDENEKVIANILHDIKSPLYSIKIGLQNKLDNELNKDIFETTLDIIKYIENFLVNYSFKKGRFEIEIDGITHEICSGDCFILPDHLYFRRSVISPIEFVYVKFTDNLSCPYSLNIPYGKVEFEDEKRFHSNSHKTCISYQDEC